MKRIGLIDIKLLDIGNTITLYGAAYQGNGRLLVLPFPDEDPEDAEVEPELLIMDSPQWESFLLQADILNVEAGPMKAIVRKSQRQIDSIVSWNVFRRDCFRCRYCGEEKPLTVDHVDLWEDGGVSVEANLIAACRRCNKLRGNMKYILWLRSAEYQRVSKNLPSEVKQLNELVTDTLPALELLRVVKQRSR